MRVLVDLCVEADGLMFKNLVDELTNRGHKVLLTTRAKVHLPELFSYLGLKPHVVGRYAVTLEGKLVASGERVAEMAKLVLREFGGLDAVVSNTGVEACRVGFGLGAQVHTFHDHPEAIHQMLLTIPLSTYVYVPWVIDRAVYVRYGLRAESIVSYHGFLVAAWMPHIKLDEHVLEKFGLDPDRPVVVFRESEVGAAYLFGKKDITLPAVKKLAKRHLEWQFVGRPRYESEMVKRYFRDCPNVWVPEHPIPLQSLWPKSSLLVGGGATMCLEATWFGTPTITCRPITSPITDWLKSVGLAWEAKTTEEAVSLAEEKIGKHNRELARKVYGEMEFPLEQVIRNIEGGKSR
jgi:predicted glycosyltransferase